MNLPELRDILLYHIAPGLWTSEYLVNNTAVVTSKASEVVPFVDGSMGEGKILLHDSCIDKPTPDGIPCTIQKSFGKCMEPFMSSPLSAQWIGGFCQRSCSRCSCDLSTGSSCAEVSAVFKSSFLLYCVGWLQCAVIQPFDMVLCQVLTVLAGFFIPLSTFLAPYSRAFHHLKSRARHYDRSVHK